MGTRLVVDVTAERARPEFSLSDDTASIWLSDGTGWAALDRAALTVEVHASREYDVESMLHPILSGSFAVMNRWCGRDVFHAGIIGVGDQAWVVTGDKGMGKSTLIAAAARRGLPVLSDDLAVVDQGRTWAGPSFVDLRPDAATTLRAGRDLGVLGARPRARLDVSVPPAQLPLAGWVTLAWDDDIAADLVPMGERMQVLVHNQAVRLTPPDPTTFLAHLARPMYRLRRPRRWDRLDDTVDALVALAA